LANILITKSGHLSLIDFGLSTKFTPFARNENVRTNVVGNYAASPERKKLKLSSNLLPTYSTDKNSFDYLELVECLYELGKELIFHNEIIDSSFNPILDLEIIFPNLLTSNQPDMIEFADLLIQLSKVNNPSGNDEISSIKNHPFFNGIDWELVRERKNPVPKKIRQYTKFRSECRSTHISSESTPKFLENKIGKLCFQ